jgi:hypothetical protein
MITSFASTMQQIDLAVTDHIVHPTIPHGGRANVPATSAAKAIHHTTLLLRL